jgi:translation initiation factor IF-3
MLAVPEFPLAHQHLGTGFLSHVQKDVEPIAKIEQFPKIEGYQMMMVLAPRQGIPPAP